LGILLLNGFLFVLILSLQKIEKFALNSFTELSEHKVLDIAKSSQPKPIEKTFLKSENINKSISVKVNDGLSFIMDPLTGILVGENDFTFILKKEDPSIGVVHIHIPKKCHGACG